MTTIRLRLAVVAAVFSSAVTVVYLLAKAEPAQAAGTLISGVPRLMVILWVAQDARRRRIGVVTDLEFFLALFWPFVFPWYAFKSRGIAGWKFLLAQFVLMFPAELTALVMWRSGVQ